MLRRLAAGEQLEPDGEEERCRFFRVLGGLQRWGLAAAEVNRKSHRWRLEITWRGLRELERLRQPTKRRARLKT